MKQSRIKRLIPRTLAQRVEEAGTPTPPELQAVVDAESASIIARMESQGFALVGRVGEGDGEGVFVRNTEMVALHVHIPQSLYNVLADEASRSEMPKRRIVIAALEEYLDFDD